MTVYGASDEKVLKDNIKSKFYVPKSGHRPCRCAKGKINTINFVQSIHYFTFKLL